jgi:signal transduction histidine kinase
MFDWDLIELRGRWNEQLAALYQFWPAAEYITREEWHSLFHPDDVVRLVEEAEKTVSESDQFQFEYRTVRPQGDIRWVLSHGRIVRDATGKAIQMIGTHTDITDRKQVEEMAKVREFTGQLLAAQDAERRRLARELHDSAGQMVAALQMQLTPMKADAGKLSPKLASDIAESLGIVQQLSQELRTVSYLLHPPLLDELGLPSALRWYVEGFAERSKVDVQLELAADLGRLPWEMETALFRVVQESLTNIHRHSGSKKARIHLHRSGDNLCLQVQDFGRGMTTSRSNGSSSTPRSGVGIQGMRERVRQLNGLFEIQSTGNGMCVNVRLPVATSTLVPA